MSGPRPAPGPFPGASGDEPDDDLARRARAGDRSAFSGLYDRFAPTVHGVLLSLGPVQEARDLVQEVFLLALRSIGESVTEFGLQRSKEALRHGVIKSVWVQALRLLGSLVPAV